MKTAREQAEEIWRKWKDVPQASIACHEDARDWWVNSIAAALEEKDREIETEREPLREQLAEAVKLLQPFAAASHVIAEDDPQRPDDHVFWNRRTDRKGAITLGHCRAAAAFLAKHKGQP